MQYTNTQNLQHHLWKRESNWNPGRRHPLPQRFLFHERNFYKSITPCLTVQNVDNPSVFLRKFTPDGQLLLGFSSMQRSLIVYEYKGISSGAEYLRNHNEDCISAMDRSSDSVRTRLHIFDCFFKKKFNVQIVPESSVNLRLFLNREFSLFLDDGKYVLVATMEGGSIFPNYLEYEQYPDLFDDTELYNYTFYLVNLRLGSVVDSLQFDNDYIVLSHNFSVSLYDRTLAILSTYRQCIELIELNAVTGKLKRLSTVGPFGSDLDRDRYLVYQRKMNLPLSSNSSLPFSHFKQKILAFMYREIMELSSPLERRQQLKEFYKNFEEIQRMIILKMQLIDNDNLLLRYEKREISMPVEFVHGDNVEAVNTNFKLYVFYNITQQKVLKMYTKDSVELLQMICDCCDDFRNVRPLILPWQPSSLSNNEFFRTRLDRNIKSYHGSISEVAVRLNPTIPISSESFSSSPYLDYSLFDFNDTFISALERPRVNTQRRPIIFSDRITNVMKFRVFLEHRPATRNTDLVSYIFHPYEPFFISVQKFASGFVVNFHLYNPTTVIKRCDTRKMFLRFLK